jgi:hypothetical protein
VRCFLFFGNIFSFQVVLQRTTFSDIFGYLSAMFLILWKYFLVSSGSFRYFWIFYGKFGLLAFGFMQAANYLNINNILDLASFQVVLSDIFGYFMENLAY